MGIHVNDLAWLQSTTALFKGWCISLLLSLSACHGHESRRFTFRAKESENKFEAALQLSLLSRIYLNGVPTAELLSALSSVFFIGKTGVQNFLQRHEENCPKHQFWERYP